MIYSASENFLILRSIFFVFFLFVFIFAFGEREFTKSSANFFYIKYNPLPFGMGIVFDRKVLEERWPSG